MSWSARRLVLVTRVVLSAVLLSPLALAACSPLPVALVGLTGSEGSPSFVAYVCRSEVRVTATVHQGSQSLFALYGHLPRRRFTRVSMAPVSDGWTVSEGELRPLPDHNGDRILLTHNGKRMVVHEKDFLKEAGGRC